MGRRALSDETRAYRHGLLERFDEGDGSPLRVPAEYLEVVITKA
ncbi:MAG: hypothetical protein AAFP86_11145 [Planctomycetota bacterium]